MLQANERPKEATGIPSVFNVRAYGALGDGTHLDTEAIQATINASSDNGGGTVLVPSGHYLTGTLFLKSNVNLHVESTPRSWEAPI